MVQENSAHAIRLDRLEEDVNNLRADVRELREWSVSVKTYGRMIVLGVPLLTATFVALLNWALRP